MKKGFAVLLSIIVIAILFFYMMHRKLSDFDEQHNNMAYTYEVLYIDEKWPLLTSSTFEPEKRGLQSRIEELIAEFQFLEEFFNRADAEDVLREYIEKVDMENADVKNMQHYIAKHMYSYLLNQNEGLLHSK